MQCIVAAIGTTIRHKQQRVGKTKTKRKKNEGRILPLRLRGSDSRYFNCIQYILTSFETFLFLLLHLFFLLLQINTIFMDGFESDSVKRERESSGSRCDAGIL